MTLLNLLTDEILPEDFNFEMSGEDDPSAYVHSLDLFELISDIFHKENSNGQKKKKPNHVSVKKDCQPW